MAIRNLYIPALLIFLVNACSTKTEQTPPNVLMIIVDDLRPELGCYGNDKILTPHIDELAAEGMVFLNSYCNIPVCGASRASLMTGLRPTRNRFLHYYTWADVEVPDAECLSQHFRNHGYYTLSSGKVFHHMDDRASSWDENWRPPTSATWRDYHIKENIDLELASGGPPTECLEVDDTAYHDGKLAEKTIADLHKMKENGKPFFMAVGFVKPHLPFTAPKKYWDLYDRESFPATGQAFLPSDAPLEAFHNSGELRAYHGIPEEGFVSDSVSRLLQHGYYACVSYTDAQVGKVLASLKELGLDKNTVVVLLGDHGWNLGEHGMWCKHCNFNTSLQAPIIIRAPEITRGTPTAAVVEFIDLYPTLCELCDLPVPETVEGRSLVPLLNDPHATWPDQAVAKYFDGLSLKTSRWAYTEWRDDTDSLKSTMLYDHDVDRAEMHNLSADHEYAAVADSLSSLLNALRGKDYFTENPVSPPDP